MRNAIWAYPWDLLDIGIDAALAEITDGAGLDAVSLATAYHAGRFLQPRSARKTYMPEDGTIYCRLPPGRFDGLALQPKLAGIVAERGDVMEALIRRRDAGGAAVHAWTVCLHNSRLGTLHPDACCRNAFGDIAYHNLCPSHPDARAYLIALIAAVTETWRPDAVELESPCFMGWAHEHHHEKDGVGLTPEDDLLLSICFCPACLDRAARAGVDGEAARRTVRSLVAEALERPLPHERWPDLRRQGPAAFAAHPELAAWLDWRFEPVTSLVAEIRAAAHPASRIAYLDIAGGWLFGADLAAIARVCDGIVFCAYDSTPDEVGQNVAAAVAAAAGKPVSAGFRLFAPEMDGADAIVARVRAASTAGATGFNFYNYGLVPAARLDWAKAGLDPLRRSHG